MEYKMYDVLFGTTTHAGATSTNIPNIGRNSDFPLRVCAATYGEAEKAAMAWADENNSNYITFTHVSRISQMGTTIVLGENLKKALEMANDKKEAAT